MRAGPPGPRLRDVEAGSSSVLPKGRRNLFGKLLLLGLVAAVVGTVPAPAPAAVPDVSGKWVGRTSQGAPLSFTVNNKRRVTKLRLPIRPIQCSNGLMPESFHPDPWPRGRKIKKFKKNGRTRLILPLEVHLNVFTGDANFLVDYYLWGLFNKKGTRLVNTRPRKNDLTYLLIAFEFAGPNNEVGYCGTDCEPGDHPMYCGDRISFLPLDWRAHKKR